MSVSEGLGTRSPSVKSPNECLFIFSKGYGPPHCHDAGGSWRVIGCLHQRQHGSRPHSPVDD